MANIPQFTKLNDMDLYDDELSQALTNAIGPNGFEVSTLSTDDIDTILSDSPNGTIWYDSTRNKFLGKENGILVSFNTTAL